MNTIELRKIEAPYITRSSATSGIWGSDVVIHKNEHIHIVAPSGSGKTSLIHFLYRSRSEYSGDILYDNRDAKRITREELAIIRQKNISIVFQDLKLFGKQTIRQNLEIKRVLQPGYPAQIIEEMARRVGIESKLDQVAETCSYGEQQRAAIIRALLQPFDFLLLDEPFSHLDENNKIKAWQLLLEECEKRKAAIVFAGLEAEASFKSEKIFSL